MESVSNGLSHNQARCRLLAWQDIENARKKACSPGVALGLLHAVDLFEARLEKADAEDEYGDTRTTFEDALGISLRHLDSSSLSSRCGISRSGYVCIVHVCRRSLRSKSLAALNVAGDTMTYNSPIRCCTACG